MAQGLEERLGALAGRTFEIHAGAAYVEGLRPALARRRARLTVPLQGLRIGEQLHWYDVRQGEPPADKREVVAARPAARQIAPAVDQAPEEVALLATTPIGPFTFRWPTDLESFAHGWDMTVRAGGSTHRVRLGVGRRVAYGRPRVRAVTWVAGQPMVEGVEADDYTESGGLLSLLRRPGGTLVRSPEEIPAGYAGCRIVDHAAEIAAPYSRHGLVIKLAEDDLVGWARHALLRMWAKAAPGSTATPAPPQPAPVPPAAAEYMRAA